MTNNEIPSSNFEAFTKGILESGKLWDWHSHEERYEFFVVLQGKGRIEFEDNTSHEYSQGDIISINPKFKHRIFAKGELDSEFFFVRLS